MRERLRILFIAPYEPSALAVRSRLLLRGLAERHDVDVLALRRHPEVGAALGVRRMTVFPSTRRDRVLALRHMVDPAFPLQSIAAVSSALTRAVRLALAQERYDIAHVEHLRALPYLPPPPRPPVLFDAVDCVSQLFDLAARERGPATRWLYRAEARRLARCETSALSSLGQVVVSAQRDAAWLRAQHPFASVSVVSNPVDISRYAPGPPVRDQKVVMTGKMSFHANDVAARWLCTEIWPRVRRRHPRAKLVIAGAAPGRRLRRLAGPGVEVTGYVDDLPALLRSAAVAVAPLRYAVGVQNKVLEALASETPVVATPHARGGLGLQQGRDVLLAESADDFAMQVCRLLDDAALARTVGRAGRRYVEAHHGISTIVGQLEELYAAMLGSPQGVAARAVGGAA